MPPTTKSKLSTTIYHLRERLLTEFHNAADSAYRLSIPLEKAGLTEENRVKRGRLENWLDEQARRANGGKKKGAEEIRERHYRSALKLAAATFLNRIVVIRHMEAVGLIKPAVVTGGWNSPGYREFRDFAPALTKDETEGFSVLLGLLFDELALDLPGLFGDVGITGLFPVPAVSLRGVVEAFDDEALETVWMDDTTLGWVYQFWNDPERIALDEKVKNRGKIERHEIASKTQLFTDRYMVEWLLQNCLNNFWLAICQKNGWAPKVRSEGVLAALESRRKEWRKKRGAGEVSAEEMMPIESDAENRWKYWVEQELTEEFVAAAPESIRELKLLDPAVGSGHFLIIAFMILAAFYREEAEHRGEVWSDKKIAESILENNLHGIDIDPRAVQIAAAALWLKARTFCRVASPKSMNLVASNLGIASLPEDDPAVRELKVEVRKATGIPEELTEKIIHSLKGADYLGSLLRVDEAVDEAIRAHEQGEKSRRAKQSQGDLFEGFRPEQTVLPFDEAKVSVLEKLDRFLEKCTSGQDLGLRLKGEQLAAGVRFIRILKQGGYHLVIANPPYHSASKMAGAEYLKGSYPVGNQDLFAAFMVRSLQFLRELGLSASVTLSNWMYLGGYEKLRNHFIENIFIKFVADLGKAAFSSGSMLINASMNILQNEKTNGQKSLAIRAFSAENIISDPLQVERNANAYIAGAKLYEFDVLKLKKAISGQPLLYWWDDDFLDRYRKTPKIADECPVRQGLATGNNVRYVRNFWELSNRCLYVKKVDAPHNINPNQYWVPYIKGAEDRKWFEPLRDVLNWQFLGVCYAYSSTARFGRGATFYFRQGISYSTIGSNFSARIRHYQSIFDVSGASVFPSSISDTVCLMNSEECRNVLRSLNPTINFQVGDVNRLPLFQIASSDEILSILDHSFTVYEAARENSIEFKKPCPSDWTYTQNWAQQAVDRPQGTPLPDYNPIYDPPSPTNHISFAIGIALGRFGPNGEGILDKAPKTALPHGILYLSNYTDADSLDHPAAQPIKDAWAEHGDAIAKNADLKPWLMEKFFKDVHLGMYEKRPIYFPLSSKKKNFVAFAGIHRWTDAALQTLLADHLVPEQNRLDGELNDLLESRRQGDRKSQSQAENRYAQVKALHEELAEFIDLVRRCAEQGPPPAKPADTPRETDARFKMDLDDGVMINSAALWPLLEPQWKDPKKWWSEFCNAKGRKDYDWSHLAARYFPKRVDEKCREDPSLAVAHGCFWKYHPAKARQWELRLQDEIAPDFTIDEDNAREYAAGFKENHTEEAEEIRKAELKRRERKQAKAEATDETEPDEDDAESPPPDWSGDSLFAEK